MTSIRTHSLNTDLVAQGMEDMLLTMGGAIKDLAEDPTQN